MSVILRSFVVLAAVGSLSFPSSPPAATGGDQSANSSRRRGVATPAPPRSAPTTADFLTTQLEHYLSDDGIAYVRPGLKLKVNSIKIGTDRKPVVDLSITDDFDNPIDRLGKTTPGVVSLSFILAAYDPATRNYTAYTTRTQTSLATSPKPGVTVTQAGTDSGGTFVDLETGHTVYTFRTVLPAGFDQTKTTTLGIYATRNLTAIVGKNYYANVVHEFRPDGGTIAATAKWDKIRTGACNNCHDPLALHGGSRREVGLCVLCHSPQTTDPDTGNTVDMKVMIHKIHRGENLANGYTIIGNQGSVHDYSEVLYPQDIRNCDNCHEGTTAAQKPTQSELWYTQPSRAACGSCHDDINWVTGENHPAGAQADDSACTNCHQPDSELEFDASVKGAHTIPLKSKQLKGLKVAIVSVTDMVPGKSPIVVFKITDNVGAAVDGSKLTTFAPMFGGPTSSYTNSTREAAPARAVFDAATGNTTFKFNAVIPADAKGTWVVTGDFYRNATLKRGDGGADITVRDAAVNPIKYVAISGTLTPRRTVVTMAQCNGCHDALALHGDQRKNIEECVVCHNPVTSDVARRPASAGLPESVSFQRMIHRIHTGEELYQEYTAYGFGGTAHNYNHVLYPGDRRNCDKCHTGNSEQLPAPKGADPVITLRDFFTPQGPGTASCLGCHDGPDAAAHAYLNTAMFPGSEKPTEACGTCHGANSEWSVDKSHAR